MKWVKFLTKLHLKFNYKVKKASIQTSKSSFISFDVSLKLPTLLVPSFDYMSIGADKFIKLLNHCFLLPIARHDMTWLAMLHPSWAIPQHKMFISKSIPNSFGILYAFMLWEAWTSIFTRDCLPIFNELASIAQ